MRLTRYDIQQALRRLAVVYPSATRELTALAEEWHRALDGLASDAVERAVTAYIASDGRFFPTPGAIRRLAREYGGNVGADARAYWAWEIVKGDGDPCPICGGVLERPGDGRPTIQHDDARHMAAGIGYVGPRSPLHRAEVAGR